MNSNNLPSWPRRVPFIAVALLSYSLLSLYPADSFATQANPLPFTITQPNGQKITARNLGDEWNNWVETDNGYTIAKAKSGVWYYVSGFSKPSASHKLSRGTVVSPQQPILSDVPATASPPSKLKKHLRPTNQRPSMSMNGLSSHASQFATPLNSSPTTGERNIVFILAEFNNQAGNYQQPAWADFVTNTIGDYYSKASYGKVSITPAMESHGGANNGVIGWVNISSQLQALETSLNLSDKTGNHPNTGQNTGQYNRLVAKAAMQAADPFINYALYDADSDGYVTADELAIVVIVAGYERSYSSVSSPSVWGHAWGIFAADGGYPTLDGKQLGASKSGVGPLGDTGGYAEFGERHGNHQATMGIMVHELGHEIFGMADLYDVNSATAPNGQVNEGMGAWSVMAGGNWAAKTGENSGATPVLPDAWTKLQMDWITPIPQRDRVLLTGVGLATATSDNSAYKVTTNGAGSEYFLIENRQNQGYDQGLQRYIPDFSGGIAILHIDDSIDCTDNACNSLSVHPHPRVYLEAGNRVWLTGSRANQQDLFYANGGWRNLLDPITVPTNSNLWNGAVKGAASGVSVNSISNSLGIMRVRVPQ